MASNRTLCCWTFHAGKLVGLTLLLLSSLALSSAKAETFRVGFAERDITPPVGYRKAGSYSEIISTAVHDPLLAKAMVVTQGDTSFALVICDLCGIPAAISDQIRNQVQHALNIPVEHIIVSATHTHGAPEFWGPLRDGWHELSIEQSGSDPRETIDYPRQLVEQAVAAVTLARDCQQPSLAYYSLAHQHDLGFNRRFHMQDGSVRFNPGKGNPEVLRPAGPIDPDLPFLLFSAAEDAAVTDTSHQDTTILGPSDHAQGRALGALTTFAMHTAIFGTQGHGTSFGADYPGYLQLALRNHFGARFVSMFGEGAAGDVNHVNINAEAIDPSPQQAAQRLADSIRVAVLHQRRLERPDLAINSRTVQAPITAITQRDYETARHRLLKNEAPFLELVAAWRDCYRWQIQSQHGHAKPLEVQCVRFDRDTALVSLPHEVFVEIGLAIKSASPFRNTMILTLANDIDYYIPTRRAFEEGSYEVTTCPLNAGCGELLIATAVDLLNQLKAD